MTYTQTDSLSTRKVVRHAKSPFILEHLRGSTSYEVFVEAVNEHGVGEESSKVVFRTATVSPDRLLEDQHPYNQSDCCIRAGVKPQCKMAD